MVFLLHYFAMLQSLSGEGNGNPLQYSCLLLWTEEPGRLHAVHGVAKSLRWLSDFTFTFHFHALEKEMAIHSSVLTWRFPGTTEPVGLPSMGSHRVGHDWSDLAAAAAAVSFNLFVILFSLSFLISIYYWQNCVLCLVIPHILDFDLSILMVIIYFSFAYIFCKLEVMPRSQIEYKF